MVTSFIHCQWKISTPHNTRLNSEAVTAGTARSSTAEGDKGPHWRTSWEGPLCPLLLQASTLLQPSPSRKGYSPWEAQSCPHTLAKVKENPENFRKKNPMFFWDFSITDLNYFSQNWWIRYVRNVFLPPQWSLKTARSLTQGWASGNICCFSKFFCKNIYSISLLSCLASSLILPFSLFSPLLFSLQQSEFLPLETLPLSGEDSLLLPTGFLFPFDLKVSHIILTTAQKTREAIWSHPCWWFLEIRNKGLLQKDEWGQNTVRRQIWGLCDSQRCC